MVNRLRRIVERYFVPRFVVSIIYFLRFRCYVNTQTRVQFSENIVFGRGTVVKSYAVVQTSSGKISFGRDCAISSFNHISAGTEDVIVGNYVRLGPHVAVLGTTRDFRRPDTLIVEQEPYSACVRIGDDVLVGAHALILPGCDIGEGAVIGAGSVVTGDVPAFTIVAGVPAKVVGSRISETDRHQDNRLQLLPDEQ